MLLDKDGYPFQANTKRGKKIYWCCRDYKLQNCPARAVTTGIYVKLWNNAHNHERRPNSRNYNRKYQIREIGVTAYKKLRKEWNQ